MANPERRSRLLDWYGNVNRVTFVGAVGVAGAAAVVPPLSPLLVPAVGWAAVDGFQIVFIDKINKKGKQNKFAEYKAKQSSDQRIPMDVFQRIEEKPGEKAIFINPFARRREMQKDGPRENVIFVNHSRPINSRLPAAA